MAKWVTVAGWDSAPHLSEEARNELLASIPPNLRRARTEGVPYLGAGAIYSAFVPVELISIDPIKIPDYWPRAYGMDVGWNRTAALWATWDRESDIIYLYSEHYMGQVEPEIHASSIRARGNWINGVIDPAANGRGQKDGVRLVEVYKNLGLRLEFADNSVEAGIEEVWNRLSTGRLKVFNTLSNFFTEYRLYRRDKNGKPIKENDHLMDSLRYLIMSGLDRMSVNRGDLTEHEMYGYPMSAHSWLGA